MEKRHLENAIKIMNKIKNGEVPQERAMRLIKTLCKDMTPKYQEAVLQYIHMDDVVISKKSKEIASIETPKREPKTFSIEEIKDAVQQHVTPEETYRLASEIRGAIEEEKPNKKIENIPNEPTL